MELLNIPLLTIAIPTYNRAEFLNQCLNSIAIQIGGFESFIEIIVSDNCSTDESDSIVQKYRRSGLVISYIKNSHNQGAEYNVNQCFDIAKGKFVWVLGDDDFIIYGAIQKIVKILNVESEVGIVHVSGKTYNDKFEIIGLINDDLRYTVYYCKSDYVKLVNYYFTFISGNIVNKSIFESLVGIEKFQNTSLPQLRWTLAIFLKSKYNIVVKDDVLGVGSVENSGGYNFYQVFALNFNALMEYFVGNGFKRTYIKEINRNLLLSFFPFLVYKQRNGNLNSFRDSSLKENFTFYQGYFIYWFTIFPLINLPSTSYKAWLSFILYLSRFHVILRNVSFTIKSTFTGRIVTKQIL